MVERYLDRILAREIDRQAIERYDLPGIVLMENAGRGCADVLCELGIRGPVVVCCGKGNNGADGFVIARHLDLRGYAVKVLCWFAPEELTGDAARNFAILRRTGIPLHSGAELTPGDQLREALGDADWIVDALLGTGSRGAPRPPLDAVIAQLNDHPARRLAVDLPSGLDCDSGEPSVATFRADCTCTFVGPKLGFRSAAAQPWLGTVRVVDIGAPRRLLEEFGVQ